MCGTVSCDCNKKDDDIYSSTISLPIMITSYGICKYTSQNLFGLGSIESNFISFVCFFGSPFALRVLIAYLRAKNNAKQNIKEIKETNRDLEIDWSKFFIFNKKLLELKNLQNKFKQIENRKNIDFKNKKVIEEIKDFSKSLKKR
jgi:hypothetical protein